MEAPHGNDSGWSEPSGEALIVKGVYRLQYMFKSLDSSSNTKTGEVDINGFLAGNQVTTAQPSLTLLLFDRLDSSTKMDDIIQAALSELLSLKSSSTQLSSALSSLNAGLASIALDSGSDSKDGATSSRKAFGLSQESFLYNGGCTYLIVLSCYSQLILFTPKVSARLIDFVARCLLRLQNHKYGGKYSSARNMASWSHSILIAENYQLIFVQLGQTMKLLQGFLLLHESSRKLFSLPCNIEVYSFTGRMKSSF